MRRFTVIILTVIVCAGGWAGNSSALTILDEYIGADPSGSSWDGKDIVGAGDLFDISKMEVNLVGDRWIVVDIYSDYFDNFGRFGTTLSDLFVSGDGWHPVLPTALDNFYNPGEDWEFAVALDDHLGTSGIAVPSPEPSSMLLLGSGLLGLAIIGRGLGRRKKKKG